MEVGLGCSPVLRIDVIDMHDGEGMLEGGNADGKLMGTDREQVEQNTKTETTDFHVSMQTGILLCADRGSSYLDSVRI